MRPFGWGRTEQQAHTQERCHGMGMIAPLSQPAHQQEGKAPALNAKRPCRPHIGGVKRAGHATQRRCSRVGRVGRAVHVWELSAVAHGFALPCHVAMGGPSHGACTTPPHPGTRVHARRIQQPACSHPQRCATRPTCERHDAKRAAARVRGIVVGNDGADARDDEGQPKSIHCR